MSRLVVMGLDLSLRGTGMVAVPADWGGDWPRIRRQTFGQKLTKDALECDRIARLILISAAVRKFAVTHECTSVVVEQYAMSPSGSRQSFSLGELGGVVRVVLQQYCGLSVAAVAPASARKHICGKLPRKDQKAFVRGQLTRMGLPPAWTADEADAFVIANYALSMLGGYSLMQPEAA